MKQNRGLRTKDPEEVLPESLGASRPLHVALVE